MYNCEKKRVAASRNAISRQSLALGDLGLLFNRDLKSQLCWIVHAECNVSPTNSNRKKKTPHKKKNRKNLNNSSSYGKVAVSSPTQVLEELTGSTGLSFEVTTVPRS